MTEIKQYLLIVKRWFWLLVVGGVLGSSVGMILGIVTKPVYQAQTKILVSSNRQDPNFEFAYLNDQQLVETYIQLLQTRPVFDAVSKKVGSEIDPRSIAIVQVRQTQIIQIVVEDQEPQRAAHVANTLVEVLIEQNESLQAGRYTSTENSFNLQIKQVEEEMNRLREEFDQISQQEIQQQLKDVDDQIKILRDEALVLQKDIAKLSPLRTNAAITELSEKQARLDQIQPLLSSYEQIRTNLLFIGRPAASANTREDSRTVQLQSTLNLYQQLYLSLINNLESLQLLRLQYTPNIDQIESAIEPYSPVRPSSMRYTIFGGIIGVVLAAAVVIAIEFLDDTIKSPKDVLEVLGLHTIASIPEFSNKNMKSDGLFILENPKSPVTDAFRLLRTGIMYGNKGKPLKTLLVVSPDQNDGRTSIALNLAASFSLMGRRVTVVDANIRAPRLHLTLGVENKTGLSDVLSDKADVTGATHLVQGQKNINALTGGSIPESPTELLESDKLSDILGKLTAKMDVVILDGPPVFVADALAFASRVDGILLILRPGRTRIETARAAYEYLQRSGGNIVGVVLSRVPRNWAKYHEGFYFNFEDLAKANK